MTHKRGRYSDLVERLEVYQTENGLRGVVHFDNQKFEVDSINTLRIIDDDTVPLRLMWPNESKSDPESEPTFEIRQMARLTLRLMGETLQDAA